MAWSRWEAARVTMSASAGQRPGEPLATRSASAAAMATSSAAAVPAPYPAWPSAIASLSEDMAGNVMVRGLTSEWQLDDGGAVVERGARRRLAAHERKADGTKRGGDHGAREHADLPAIDGQRRA